MERENNSFNKQINSFAEKIKNDIWSYESFWKLSINKNSLNLRSCESLHLILFNFMVQLLMIWATIEILKFFCYGELISIAYDRKFGDFIDTISMLVNFYSILIKYIFFDHSLLLTHFYCGISWNLKIRI